MNKLWQKDKTKIHPLIEEYTVGEDYIYDKELLLFDIQASKAHAKGLEKIGIINQEELIKLTTVLDEISEKFKQGEIEIAIQDEDCHTVIENYLVEELGDIGKKIHTGRSRNDQTLVTMRLFMRDTLQEIKKLTVKTAKDFLEYAKKYQNVPLPGYTHTQQAMLSSLGHYFSSFTESLIDDIEFLDSIDKQINKNPLGSAAGFGVSFPLDRQSVTLDLNFRGIQINSLYCLNSRGKYESIFLEGLYQIMTTLGRFASDLLFFTTQELSFFIVDDNLVTGSSIMPQKKNHDTMEILRANVNVVTAYQNMLKEISKNLISGYNRDLQLTKKPVIESVKIVKQSLQVVSVYLNGIKPNEEQIKSQITKEIFAADIANDLVKKKKLPFREAYNQAMQELKTTEIDYQTNLQSKISLGGPGNLALPIFEQKLEKLST